RTPGWKLMAAQLTNVPMCKQCIPCGSAIDGGQSMSVQAGIRNFEGEPVDPGLVKAILESLGEQGPDGKYPLVLGNVRLLYRPFHTTHESRREKQPYVSDRGSFLTWDGRLDNRSELCQELHLSRSDDFTEVELVSAAFDRWGTDCFPRIIGDWAVCIWNPKDCELVLAVDYMAVR